VTFGIEHGSDDILALIGKETNRETNLRSVRAAKSAGLRVRAQMIVGLPGETDQTVEATAQFMREAPADSYGVHIFVPLPGSPIWADPDKYGFEINEVATFDLYQTIGRPDEWTAHKIHKNPEQVAEWAGYLRDVAGERNVSNFDARLQETTDG
jgi:radical SAM superfamily enzyme YgiQ (UPF0313 family)